jgi:hypothetical protein
MNNPDHFSESLENLFFGLIYLNSLLRIRDPGWKKFGSGIRNKHPGSWFSITVVGANTWSALRCLLEGKMFTYISETIRWSWFIVFIPLWLYDAMLLIYLVFLMVSQCRNSGDRQVTIPIFES